jgi:flavin reductase (DIM6/NTAB) family NADH-FMN oxidoreductase RutF
MTYRRVNPAILYFGTPVALLSTCNPDGSPNLAPMSSCWALGHTLVLGLGRGGQTAANLIRTGELVVNLPGPQMWEAVEALAPLTGAADVPAHKRSYSRYQPAKFEAAGLTPLPSARVRPPRVDGCDLQLEATVRSTRRGGPDGTFVIVEAEVICIHAAEEVVVAGTHHIDPTRWRPLIYSFRHYFGVGAELGHSFRAER